MISFQPSDLLARSGSAPCSYSSQVRFPSSNSRGESHHLIGGNWGESHHLIGGNWGESHHLIGGNWGESHPVPLFFWIDTLQNRVSAFFIPVFGLSRCAPHAIGTLFALYFLCWQRFCVFEEIASVRCSFSQMLFCAVVVLFFYRMR